MTQSLSNVNIVAETTIPFLKGKLELLGNVTYLYSKEFSNEKLKNADVVVIRTGTKLTRELLQGTSVKLICTASIGFDHIDISYCKEQGIEWHNAPGCNSSSVQQYIASALSILSQQKKIDIKATTIGIIGVGNVGKKVSYLCKTLGMNVLENDPPRAIAEKSSHFVSLAQIAATADIISFHTPLIKEGEFKTYHLADKNFFESLKKKPIIINTARGSVVDTTAIKEAIEQKKISEVIIDCWEDEPNIDTEYMNSALIATPHIAGYSTDGKANGSATAMKAICNFIGKDSQIIGSIDIQQPSNNIINLNDFKSSDRITEALLHTYNPLEDMKQLVADATAFANLRNTYPLRREYHAYTIINATSQEKEVLSKLGFQFA